MTCIACGIETVVPIRERSSQVTAKLLQRFELLLDLGQLLRRESSDLSARRTARVPLCKDEGELIEREPETQRPLHEMNALDGSSRIHPVTVRQTSRHREHFLSLVMPQRIRAQARLPRELTRQQEVVFDTIASTSKA